MITASIEELLGNQYDVLGHGLVPNQLTEIRDIKNGKSYWCKSREEYIRQASLLTKSDVYVGINPRSIESGKNSAVKFLSCLVIDIDPVRPVGQGSTDEQHKESAELASKLATTFQFAPIVSSGSGSHVYVPINPIEVINQDELSISLRNFTTEIRKKYSTTTLRIDPIYDLARVIRIWGSLNTKSNRLCGPVSDLAVPIRKSFAFSQVKSGANLPTSDGDNKRFYTLVEANKRLKELVEGTLVFPSRSEADFEFVSILAKAHFSESEINSLMKLNPLGRKDEAKPDDVKRIISKIQADSKSNSISLIHNSNAYYKSLSNRKMGIRTGLNRVDETISGLKGGKTYIIAARPGVGKTSLITQILTHISGNGHTCLFFPTEVGSEPIFDKIVSRKTGVSLKKFQNGSFLDADVKKIEEIRASISNLPLIVYEEFGLTIETIENEVKKYAPDLVAIDFFQALAWKDPSSVGEKGDAFRRIKQLAIDMNIPFIIASQLNRSDGKQDLKQLNGTGALEQLGDVISFLSVDNTLTYPRVVDWNILKSKYSATGNVKLNFFSSIGDFQILSGEDNAQPS